MSSTPTAARDPRVAYHEAGHAVVAHLVGRPCKLATVRPYHEVLGHVLLPRHPVVSIDPRLHRTQRDASRRQLHHNVLATALISLAGEAAEALWKRFDPRQYAQQIIDLRITDFESAAYEVKLLWHLLTRGGQLGERASREAVIEGVCAAHALLVPNRRALDAVAAALLQRETLGSWRLALTIRRTAAAPHVGREVQPGSLFVRPPNRLV